LILLDTHVALWLTADPGQLSPAARAEIKRARSKGEPLSISDITLLELTTLVGKGRVQTILSFEALLQEMETRFRVLPINSAACARILQLPSSYPRDPADRLIGATALANELTLLTADGEIRRPKAVPTFW
jgi:PIN domain nuclease of toxin-antitoxin system